MSDARSRVYAFVNRRGEEMARYGPPAPYQKMIEADSDDDLHLHGLLNQVEDDRAHAEAVKLREKVASWGLPATPRAQDTARAWRTVADEIDPYEERDGQLVRKSDGQPVTL